MINEKFSKEDEEFRQKFGAKFKKLRQILGLRQRELATILDIKQPYISSYERGEKLPSFSVLVRLHKKLGIDLNVLLDPEKEVEEINIDTDKFPLVGFFPVKLHSSALSAGFGNFPADLPPEPVVISERLIHWFFRTTPEGLVLFPVVGNSMEPTIPDGSLVIVKLFEKEGILIEGAIYALFFDDELYIKRIQRRCFPDGTVEWKLLSDNPAYDPIVFKPDQVCDIKFELIGRVLGYLKGLSR